MMLVITASTIPDDTPVMAIPNAVPLAGGCSASKATINKIEIPTAREYTRMEAKIVEWGIKDANEPETSPIMWPIITLLGLAVRFLGMANTMKAVAPIDAITTAFSMVRTDITTATTVVANKLWYR